jgi:hypothetical protein
MKLEKGLVIPSGNFILDQKIKSLDEFWAIIKTEKSIFYRHRMYPSSFFFSWQIKMIADGIFFERFWLAVPCSNAKKPNKIKP